MYRRKNMEMTAPVISTAGQSGVETMQFVMEREYGERGENLPNPRDAKCVLTLLHAPLQTFWQCLPQDAGTCEQHMSICTHSAARG